MQEQLDALDSIVMKLVQSSKDERKQNEELKQELAAAKAELDETRKELSETRQKLEDTGIRIGLLIEQLTKDAIVEPEAEAEKEEPAQDPAPAYPSFS